MGNDLRMMAAIFTLPLMAAMLMPDESCRSNKMNNEPTKKTESVVTGKTDRARTGAWGGKDVSANITETGATIEYSCAEGTISQPIILDKNGNFDVKGVYVAEHGGPVRMGEDNSHPARYSGRIEGDKWTLTVTLTDKKETIGTYTLTYGAITRLVKCL